MIKRLTYPYDIFSLYSHQLCPYCFYIGVTNNLIGRILQHRNNESIFTARYKCYYLMYHEDYADIRNAIAQEKQLKNWKREWKIELIRKMNPDMKDLAEEWLEKGPGSSPG